MNSCRSHKYIIKQFLCSLSENGENMYEIFWTKPESFYSNTEISPTRSTSHWQTNIVLLILWFHCGSLLILILLLSVRLHCVDVGSVLNVLEVHAASIFRAELCWVGEFSCIWRCLFGNWGRGVGVWEWWTLGWVTAWEHQLLMIFCAFIKIIT
jgi:hypothetical protein